MDIRPFTVNVPQPMLDDLRARLARTRWPDEVDDAGWDYGANLAYMRELVQYWATRFDWRRHEHALNAFPQFRADVEGIGVHFIHVRGRGPAPMPLLITHGWPSSVVEILEIIPRLADPGAHGGDPADAFDVIVPSVPGFGFSDRPGRGMTRSRVAGLWARLMEGLGYARYALHANDIGAVISGWLAYDAPERVIALHTLMPTFPGPVIGEDARPLTAAERAFEEVQARWMREEAGYNAIQEPGRRRSPTASTTRRRGWPRGSWRSGARGPIPPARWSATSRAICSSPMSPSTGSPRPPTPRIAPTTSGRASPAA
jgi:pimeloyl-ACP methyl ester carboxylesterase